MARDLVKEPEDMFTSVIENPTIYNDLFPIGANMVWTGNIMISDDKNHKSQAIYSSPCYKQHPILPTLRV